MREKKLTHSVFAVSTLICSFLVRSFLPHGSDLQRKGRGMSYWPVPYPTHCRARWTPHDNINEPASDQFMQPGKGLLVAEVPAFVKGKVRSKEKQSEPCLLHEPMKHRANVTLPWLSCKQVHHNQHAVFGSPGTSNG